MNNSNTTLNFSNDNILSGITDLNKIDDNKSNSLYESTKNKKKSIIKSNNFMKNILSKVKEQLVNEEIKNEIFFPIYNEIYFKILPHYLTFLILLGIIIILLLILIYITINIKYSNTNFY